MLKLIVWDFPRIKAVLASFGYWLLSAQARIGTRVYYTLSCIPVVLWTYFCSIIKVESPHIPLIQVLDIYKRLHPINIDINSHVGIQLLF